MQYIIYIYIIKNIIIQTDVDFKVESVLIPSTFELPLKVILI